MNTFLLTLAYKHVAFAAMLALANEFRESANLPIKQPLTITDVQSGSHVSPPRLMGFGGSLITSNHFFGFNNGYLANFKKLEPNLNSDSAYKARNIQLAGMKSKVDSDGAYQLATNWLTRAGIEVLPLESQSGHRISQRSFLKHSSNGTALNVTSNEIVLLPVFDIEWGSKEVKSSSATYPMPLLVVTVFGPTKEMIEMHITDDSVVGGAKKPIRDVDKLLDISDATFLRYDPNQKSNLVVVYASILQLSNAEKKSETKR